MEYISCDSINIKVQNKQYLELQVWYNRKSKEMIIKFQSDQGAGREDYRIQQGQDFKGMLFYLNWAVATWVSLHYDTLYLTHTL